MAFPVTPRRRHKYRATPVMLNGIRFDSKREAQRYLQLLMLQRAGDIADLELQPEFVIATKPRKRVYRADFRYTETGTGATVVEDVKGFDTETSRLKRALVFDQYGIEVQIIK